MGLCFGLIQMQVHLFSSFFFPFSTVFCSIAENSCLQGTVSVVLQDFLLFLKLSKSGSPRVWVVSLGLYWVCSENSPTPSHKRAHSACRDSQVFLSWSSVPCELYWCFTQCAENDVFRGAVKYPQGVWGSQYYGFPSWKMIVILRQPLQTCLCRCGNS